MNDERMDIGEPLWRELMLLLSELDDPSQNFANKIGARLVVSDHLFRCRSIEAGAGSDGIYRKIHVSFYLRDVSKGWARENISFGCTALAWKDTNAGRMLWNDRIWQAGAPPTDYLEAYEVYERAWERLRVLTEQDLRPAAQ